MDCGPRHTTAWVPVPSQKSGFQVQVRASQPAPSLTTPPRTLQYPDEVKGAEQTPIVGGELQRLRLNASD